MQKDAQKYALRGVSANKSDVHAAIKNMDKGLYPLAFCKILPDFAAGNARYCNIMHADTAGTKTSLAYMYWRETGDLSVWKGIVQDAIVMNLDDMGCVGCLDNIILSSTIGRNKNLITGDVIRTLIEATVEFVDKMKEYGINIHLAGGETADVGDIVRTIDVGYTAFARMPRKNLIVNNVKEGDLIVGFASYGQATYESEYNGGMGCNGLTSARHDVLNHAYTEGYPDSYDSNTPKEVIYTGNKKLTDTLDINGQSFTVGKLLLSPTRTFLPLLKKIIENTDGTSRNNREGGLTMKNVGHPLIPSDKRIGNDVVFSETSFIVLTGSNMSGKSTFLRTLGVNLVLAKMGSPVCATEFSFYPYNIFVSMRVSDSLQNSESFFFAELKRLKRIITELENNQKTFVILDEILRGTNSNDKRAGTIGLIKNLMAHKAVGIIATHDLVIGDMEKDYPNYLQNKCFEVELSENGLIFDYKLHNGVAQHMSAAFLMEKMGIVSKIN